MLIDVINTCDFINEAFNDELRSFNIKLVQADKKDNGLLIHYEYDFNNKHYKSSFKYNLNDDIMGWLGVCRLLETLKSQMPNILRHEVVRSLEKSYSIIVDEKVNSEVNRLKEVEIELNQESVSKLLINEISFVSFVVKFSDNRAYTIENSNIFTSDNIKSKTLIILRRLMDDIIKNNGRESLYENKDILSLSNIIGFVFTNNMEKLSDLIKKYNLSLNRYQSETFISMPTTSVLKIED